MKTLNVSEIATELGYLVGQPFTFIVYGERSTLVLSVVARVMLGFVAYGTTSFFTKTESRAPLFPLVMT